LKNSAIQADGLFPLKALPIDYVQLIGFEYGPKQHFCYSSGEFKMEKVMKQRPLHINIEPIEHLINGTIYPVTSFYNASRVDSSDDLF